MAWLAGHEFPTEFPHRCLHYVALDRSKNCLCNPLVVASTACVRTTADSLVRKDNHQLVRTVNLRVGVACWSQISDRVSKTVSLRLKPKWAIGMCTSITIFRNGHQQAQRSVLDTHPQYVDCCAGDAILSAVTVAKASEGNATFRFVVMSINLRSIRSECPNRFGSVRWCSIPLDAS